VPWRESRPFGINPLGREGLLHNQLILATACFGQPAGEEMPINEFRAISTFAKAVELGSIRRAALAQGVTPQAAS